jgi:hypothetical protein
MNFKILTYNNADEWIRLLNKLPIDQQDVYYTPEYYKLYENLGDGLAECFVFEHNGEFALYPYLINRVNDLRFNLEKEYFDIQGAYGYNGVVSSSYEKDFIDFYNRSFSEYANDKGIIAEFTRFHPILKNQEFSKKHIQIVFDRKTIFVDLQKSITEIFSSFQTTTRKQIKRSTSRHNIEVKSFDDGTPQIDTFLNIYSEAMNRVNSSKYLYFNREYFVQLLNNPDSTLFIAEMDNAPIAAIITIKYNQYLHGHLGGALTNYLSFSPYSLLYFEMIKYGIDNNCKYLHLGGGTSGDENDPLLKYKLNFSDNTADFYIGKKVYNDTVYSRIVNEWKKNNPEKIKQFERQLLIYRN